MSTTFIHYVTCGVTVDVATTTLKEALMWRSELDTFCNMYEESAYELEKEIGYCKEDGVDSTELEQRLADLRAEQKEAFGFYQMCDDRVVQLKAEAKAAAK